MNDISVHSRNILVSQKDVSSKALTLHSGPYAKKSLESKIYSQYIK